MTQVRTSISPVWLVVIAVLLWSTGGMFIKLATSLDAYQVTFFRSLLAGLTEGTMEVISKTLQGQISNFQDAWDRMLNDLGTANEGTFAGLIGGATSLVQNYETVIDSISSGAIRNS